MSWENASRGELEDEIYRLTDRVERAIVIAERFKEQSELLLSENEQLHMQVQWLTALFAMRKSTTSAEDE
jgi:hypothetical protein